MNPFLLSKKNLQVVLLTPLLVLSLLAEKQDSGGFSLAIPRSAEPIVIEATGLKIVNLFSSPEIEGLSGKTEWACVERTKRERTLGGLRGALTTDRFQAEGLELFRETWISNDRKQAAFRHRLMNRGTAPLRLIALHPFDCQGAAGLILSGAQAKDWAVLVEERRKNGLPRALSPLKEPTFEADPFFVLNPGASQSLRLLIGHLSQTGHLATVSAEFTKPPANVTLKRLFSNCEFDKIVIPPGGERAGQWLLLWASNNPRELIDGFVEAVGQFHGPADRIRALGYRPGIWTCPYLVDSESRLAKSHPEWLLRNNQGQPVIFTMNQRDHWVLDPTFPGVCAYLEETYRKLAEDWEYEYYKFDFMRAVFLPADQKFYNSEMTRLEAYRTGLEAIRRGVGPVSYISVCGGHYGGSLGLADSQRSGSDVLSIWRASEIPKFRQNLLRTYMSRLWHVDPDAMMVRRNTVKVHPDSDLSLGLLSIDRARAGRAPRQPAASDCALEGKHGGPGGNRPAFLWRRAGDRRMGSGY